MQSISRTHNVSSVNQNNIKLGKIEIDPNCITVIDIKEMDTKEFIEGLDQLKDKLHIHTIEIVDRDNKFNYFGGATVINHETNGTIYKESILKLTEFLTIRTDVELKGSFKFIIKKVDVCNNLDSILTKILTLIKLQNFKPQNILFLIDELNDKMVDRVRLAFLKLNNFFSGFDTISTFKKLEANIEFNFIAPDCPEVNEFSTTIGKNYPSITLEHLLP